MTQPADEKLLVQPGHGPHQLGMTRSPQVPGRTPHAGQVGLLVRNYWELMVQLPLLQWLELALRY